MNYGIEELTAGIRKLAVGAPPITIMEVCGTHTWSIRRYGIQSLLPENIQLVSGPGCPVCVTSQKELRAAISIADRDEVIFTCFGDMMRVPCSAGSLSSLRDKGRDVRLVTSPLDALSLAEKNPDKQVVYFGIGFETTAPHTAALIRTAESRGTENISLLNAHKTMPNAIRQVFADEHKIDALLCPGHVASVIGSDAFEFVAAELHRPAAIAGFEAYGILAAILKILDMIRNGEQRCVNMHPSLVTRFGNRNALAVLEQVFEPCDAVWRGIGEIPGSGLKLRDRYREFDAERRFAVQTQEDSEPRGCLCAEILRGAKGPKECIHFGRSCTPDRPLGPCMVSSEGSCAAYYHYESNRSGKE